MSDNEIKEIQEISDTPFSRGFLNGVESTMKENNQNFYSCGLSNMEKILETWSEIKKQGCQLEQMGMDSNKSSDYGKKIGIDFAKTEFYAEEGIKEGKHISSEEEYTGEKSNIYLDSFNTSVENYINDNEIPHDKAEKIREVCACCADLIAAIGNEALLEGKNESYISAVASGHGIVAAFSLEQNVKEASDISNETQESTEEDNADDDTDTLSDKDGTPDPNAGTKAAPSVDFGNVRTPEHTYHCSTNPEDEEKKTGEEETPKGISIKDLEKLAIFHQLHQAAKEEKESRIPPFRGYSR